MWKGNLDLYDVSIQDVKGICCHGVNKLACDEEDGNNQSYEDHVFSTVHIWITVARHLAGWL